MMLQSKLGSFLSSSERSKTKILGRLHAVRAVNGTALSRKDSVEADFSCGSLKVLIELAIGRRL